MPLSDRELNPPNYTSAFAVGPRTSLKKKKFSLRCYLSFHSWKDLGPEIPSPLGSSGPQKHNQECSRCGKCRQI